MHVPGLHPPPLLLPPPPREQMSAVVHSSSEAHHTLPVGHVGFGVTHCPDSQTWPEEHVALQKSVPPQPSGTVPWQELALHVAGWQGGGGGGGTRLMVPLAS